MASKSLISRILTKDEMQKVLTDLNMLYRRGDKHRQRLAFFRVCACCGLRASEIAGLKVGNVKPFGPYPEIDVPAAIAKCNKRRSVPLYWDSGTKEDIQLWWNFRKVDGSDAPFFHTMQSGHDKTPVSRQTVYQWWRKAIAILGPERSGQIGGPHSGRHTFCTHALAGGRSLGEVREAAGHSSVAVTDIYIHAMPRRGVQDLWKQENVKKIYEDLDSEMEEYYKYRSDQGKAGRTLGNLNNGEVHRW